MNVNEWAKELIREHGLTYVLIAMVLSILLGASVGFIAIATYPLMIYGFWHIVISCIISIASVLTVISVFVFVTETDFVKTRAFIGTILAIATAIMLLRIIKVLSPKVFYIEFFGLSLNATEAASMVVVVVVAAGSIFLIGAIDYIVDLLFSNKKQTDPIKTKRKPISTTPG